MFGSGARLLRTAARAQAGRTVLLTVANAASTGAQLALPAALGATVDALIEGRDFTGCLLLCASLVALYVVTEALSDYTAGLIQARSALFFRRLATRRVLAAGPYAPAGPKSGEFATLLLESAAAASMGTNAAVWLGFSLAPALVALAALWWTDASVGLVFTCGLPLAAWCLKAFAADSSRLVAGYLDVQGEISARLTEALDGARTIAVSHTSEREVARILAPLPRLRCSGQALWQLQGKVTARTGLLFPLLNAAVVATAGLALGAGRITPGQLLAAAEYAAMGTGLGMSMLFISQLSRARAGAERLATLTASRPMRYGEDGRSVARWLHGATQPEHETRGRAGPGLPGARAEIRGAVVRRGGRTLLDHVDLTVAPGRVTALVGRSGSGKSMAAALLGRLLDPDEGAVLLDGIPVPQVPKSVLRRQIAVAFEKPALLGGDVAAAITAGLPGATGQDVLRAARLARAESFIGKMPEGFATELATVAMSGGEAQRVGLARAFIRPARLLILDDATSSLDMATEHEVNQALLAAMPGTTRVVVAHRVSSAARADTVVWLDGGRVRAVGAHAGLWLDPEYRAVFEPTASGARTEAAR
ncbi:ABC transporter ATP-binding protein [Streptomyces sp. NPDC050485]|uniref:ABC transporter ATP-binding protein n=1 Tax=Streptomyces sp. NPDC050485 TaxID=3365617 RepID=UPI0037AE02B0